MTAAQRRAVVAAGGTGGHLFPAQALAEALAARGWRIVLATDERGALCSFRGRYLALGAGPDDGRASLRP